MIKINKVKNAAMKQVNVTKNQVEKIRSSHGFQLAAGSVVAATSYYVFGKAVDITSTAIAEMVKDAFNNK